MIDRILVRVGSGHNLMSVEEWEALDIMERLTIVKEERAQFLDGEQEVPATEALRQIREMRDG